MFRKYMQIFFLVCLPITSYAGTMFLEDYPVMYFADKNGVKLDVVQDIIIDAIDRSSYPKHLWTVDSEKPGEIIARLNVRSHVLRMKITFDTHKINYQYYDSVRLSYSENAAGTRRIHDKYKPWSEFLLGKIKFVAKRKTKMSLVNTSPIQVTVKTATGNEVKPLKMIISAFGEIGDRARAAGIYDDTTNSNLITKEIEKQLEKLKPVNIKQSIRGWNESFAEFIKRHKNSTLSALCKQENADMVFIGFLEPYLGGSGGLGKRHMFYYSYTCATDDIISKSYEIIDDFDEKFPYQINIAKTVKTFIHRFNIFK